MRTRLILLLTLLVLAPAAAWSAERLVLPPYPAAPPWKEATHRFAGLQFLIERIPADQSIDAYRDILTAQSFPAQRGVDPSLYLRTVAQGVSGACQAVRVNGPKAGREGGYAVAYSQFYCGRQNGQPFGAILFFKAISGAAALYVVQREFRVPPTATPGAWDLPAAQAAALLKAQQAAEGYLVGQVYLCGPTATDRRCR